MKIGIKTNPIKWISTDTGATIAPGTPMIRRTKRTITTVGTATAKAGITTGNRGKKTSQAENVLMAENQQSGEWPDPGTQVENHEEQLPPLS